MRNIGFIKYRKVIDKKIELLTSFVEFQYVFVLVEKYVHFSGKDYFLLF